MARTAPITLFKWGYEGWGNATELLVRTVEAVERARGHAPPLFVDIRFSRSARAKGFSGGAFEKLVGPERHRWMKGLGNEAIREDHGEIRIHRPADAEDLLDAAIEADSENRRVIFFCHCPSPAAAVHCHRFAVTELLLIAAQQRQRIVGIEEWPGGEPAPDDVQRVRVDPGLLRTARSGVVYVRLTDEQASTELAGLPWGGLVELDAGDDAQLIASGPLRYRAKHWELPIFRYPEPDANPADVHAEAMKARAELGLVRHALDVDRAGLGAAQ